MKKFAFAKHSLFLSLLAILIIMSGGCRDEINDTGIDIPDEVLKINKFITTNMDRWYFWNSEMPSIDPYREPNSEELFYKLLKSPDDRWSFITDDVVALENYFAGIIKSKGYSLQLYYLQQGSNQVIGIIEYVYRNSPASNAGLKRGDIIYLINGEQITDANFQRLLNLDNITITLGWMDSERRLHALLPSIDISAVENLVHHPVVASTIIETTGAIVGYIAYTSFIPGFDSYLENIFGDFKARGVTELVLDLRYNGGGSVSSALKLANMIAPQSAVGKVFIRENWNRNLTHFNQELKVASHPNNLGLSRLFVLTTAGTASASEMIIYGLEPHMQVIHIGETTHGKYYASVMLTDNNANPGRRTHNWAIQPIVLRSENKDNSINYQQGLPPDHILEDIHYNAQLGDPAEHFLAATLSFISTGRFASTSLKSATLKSNRVEGFRRLMDPMHGTMLTTMPGKE